MTQQLSFEDLVWIRKAERELGENPTFQEHACKIYGMSIKRHHPLPPPLLRQAWKASQERKAQSMEVLASNIKVSELPSASIFYYDLKTHFGGSRASRAASLPSRDGLMARIRNHGIYVHGSSFCVQVNFMFEYHFDDISLRTFETEMDVYNPDLKLQRMQIRTTYRYLVGALWPEFTRSVRKAKLQEAFIETKERLDLYLVPPISASDTTSRTQFVEDFKYMNPKLEEAEKDSYIQAAWTHSCGHLARARLELNSTSLDDTAVSQLPLTSPTRTVPATNVTPMSLVGRLVQPPLPRCATIASTQEPQTADDVMDGCQTTNAEDVALLPVYMMHETYMQAVTDYNTMKHDLSNSKQDLSNSKQEAMELKQRISDLEAEITDLRVTNEDNRLALLNGHGELQVTAALAPIFKAEMEQLKELLILERRTRKNNVYENALVVAHAEIAQLKAQLQNSGGVSN
ncbi:hypothetical protein MMC27_001182 [Xylographa pallens]|nr:hypothetical protein [Xylographa pallens]